MRQRSRSGSVVLDKRIKTWNFFFWEKGKRRSRKIGTMNQFPTKASAWRAAKPLRHALENESYINPNNEGPNVSTLVAQYRAEKMPERNDTRRSYEAWLKNHIIPKWGDCALSNLQARPVELWIESLKLSPKSRAHVRGLLRTLWEFAMWRGDIPTQRNPIELVTIRNITKRTKQPRSLTVEEFQMFIQQLSEPFCTMALLCCCLGLRISECLALRWSDVDWFNARLRVERGIVCQRVDNVKTTESRKQMSIDVALLALLKTWKQVSQFSGMEDWIFASPVQLGRLPWSYPWVWRMFQNAATQAGVGKLSTHTMRHSYRSWLDAVGTGIVVQQKLMRHADIRTTMNVYGDVVTDEMQQANAKVAGLALNGR